MVRRRAAGDIFQGRLFRAALGSKLGNPALPVGRYGEGRLRLVAAKHDLVSVIACAFDHRTRMLPFIFADTRMAPAGVRGIGSAMMHAVLTDVRAQGLKVIAACPFVEDYIARHREFSELLA